MGRSALLLSDCYATGEDEIGWAGEGDVMKAVIVLFESDFHDIATCDADADGGGFSAFEVVDEG